MDPSHPFLERLLDDVEEDESMHSGAAVEALTAELSEVAGSGGTSAAASEPLDHGAGEPPVAGMLHQESKSTVKHSNGQQQDSVKNEVGNKEPQQQEQNHLPCNNEQSSISKGISEGADDKHLHSNIQKECDQPKFEQEPGNNSQQSVVSQQQPMQQMKSQQTQVTNKTNNATTVKKTPVVTFHMLIPILSRHLDEDKDMQVQSIFAKLRKNEVSKDHFLKAVRTIVGDKLLKQAAAQYQMQAAQAQQNPQSNPNNYSLLSQASSQQNVPSGSMAVKQGIDSPRPTQFRPSSSGQMRSNTGYPALESNLQKPNETPNIHLASVQARQHHAQHPQTSLPVSGANNMHARSFPQPVGVPMMALRPQMADSNQRGQLVQGTVTTVAGNVVARPSFQTNSFTQTAHMSKETVEPRSESGQSSFAALHANQVNPSLLSSKGGSVLESQSSILSASKSLTATSSSQPHRSHGTQAESNIQIQSTAQTTHVPASKTPQKKASAGQKKPLEAMGSSPPPSSKKQKVSGGFHDQSIDQLNDVTAVSGVNLREEEEQLFSSPKEESRVSEAARKVVQVEEERLILEKGSLTMKLEEIMRKCNLKSIGSDVERCLSMCVEERLRGFISNIIRLSKQRVDVEKSKHRFYPLSSDVRSHILRVNREAREQWDKKLAEDAERIRKQNDGDDNAVLDSGKDKNDCRSTSKHAKTYKEEDDKMRTTAANAAVRVAAGGDDMLSKWQLLAERNKQRSEGVDGSAGSLLGNVSPHKPSPKSGKGSREQQENEKRGYFSMFGPGGIRRSAHKVVRSITVKDVIAALEREPQMSKSSLLFRLHGRSSTESATK